MGQCVVLYMKREIWTQTHRKGNDMRRQRQSWSDVPTSLGMPRSASSHQKLGERYGIDFPSQPPEGINPADTLILDFCLQKCGRINFCCFKPPNLWHLCHRNPRT